MPPTTLELPTPKSLQHEISAISIKITNDLTQCKKISHNNLIDLEKLVTTAETCNAQLDLALARLEQISVLLPIIQHQYRYYATLPLSADFQLAHPGPSA